MIETLPHAAARYAPITSVFCYVPTSQELSFAYCLSPKEFRTAVRHGQKAFCILPILKRPVYYELISKHRELAENELTVGNVRCLRDQVDPRCLEAQSVRPFDRAGQSPFARTINRILR